MFNYSIQLKPLLLSTLSPLEPVFHLSTMQTHYTRAFYHMDATWFRTHTHIAFRRRVPSTSPADTSLSWDTSTSNNSPNSESPCYDDSTEVIRRDVHPPKSVYPAYDPPVESVVEQIEEAALREMSLDLDEPFTPAIEFNSYNSIPASLAFCRKLASTAFFLKNFATPARQKDSMRGYLEILLPIYQNAPMDSLVHQATDAVAMASLSNGFKTRLLRLEAQNLYGKALREVGNAIKDPILARSDELLISILLFSLYEAITATDESRASWTQHISGAVSLIKLRGEEQLKNPQSLHLFRAVRASMLTSSIIQGRPIEDFPASGGWSCDDDGNLNAANRLTLICLTLPNIKAYAQDLLTREKTAMTINEMMSLIKTAKEIDSQLEHWALTVPEEWAYTTVEYCREEPKDLSNSQFWQGPIHVYHDLSVANIINDYRISRIFCQAVILGCISALPPHAKTEQTDRVAAQATYITQQMVDDFSSSIPFLLGYKVEGMAKAAGMTEGCKSSPPSSLH